MTTQREPDLQQRHAAQQVDTSAGPVWVVDDGRADAPAVLLLHALGTDHSLWDDLAGQLARSRRVLRIDAPGHGGSPLWHAGTVSLQAMARSVLEVIDRLLPDRRNRVDMVGTSMGAVVALHSAGMAAGRCRRLVLCGALLQREGGSAGDMQRRSESIRLGGMAALAETMLERWFPPRTDGDDALAIMQLRRLMLQTPPGAYAACSDALSTYDLRDALHRAQRSALLIAGERDAGIAQQMRVLHANYPATRYVCMPDTGHFPHLQRPDWFFRLVEEFLDGAD